TGSSDAALRKIHRAAAPAHHARRDGRVRSRHEGCPRERWSGDDMAGEVRVPVILASSSPRRRELLTLIGLEHEVRPADVDESLQPREIPRGYAERLARAKANASATTGSVSIGSDTIVVVDGDVLGKPKSEADAAAMLRRLSGRSHIVMTAIA